jgi:hypothetical protein
MIRETFREMFERLNRWMELGWWDVVNGEFRNAVDDDWRVRIARLRFTSPARNFIDEWEPELRRVEMVLNAEGLNAMRHLRGLLPKHSKE